MKHPKQHLVSLSTGLILGSLAFGLPAMGQTIDPLLDALIKKGVLTESEAKQVQAEVESKKLEIPKEAPKTSPWVQPLGPESKLRLGGFIQGQGEFGGVGSWEGNFTDNPANAKNDPTAKINLLNVPSDTGNRANLHDRFRVRRARVNVSGEFLESFDFKLEGDFSQGDGLSSSRTAFSGTDLYLNYDRFPEVQLKFGQFKAPFGLEQLTADTSLFTIERSLATEALTPERQIGAQLWGQPFARVTPNNKSLLEYSLGVFNGNGRNITINDNTGFMYAGRVSITPFVGKLFDQPVKWRLGANAYYNRYGPGTRIDQTGPLLLNPVDGSLAPLTVSSFGDANAMGWGIDQTLTIGPFDLVAEYLEGRFKNSDHTTNITSVWINSANPLVPSTFYNLTDFVANGWYVQGSYFFPGKKLQLVGKYESFNPGQDRYLPADLVHQDDIRSLTGGLNWYIKGDYLKIMFEYIHTWSEFRAKNVGTGNREFDMGMVRLQLMF